MSLSSCKDCWDLPDSMCEVPNCEHSRWKNYRLFIIYILGDGIEDGRVSSNGTYYILAKDENEAVFKWLLSLDDDLDKITKLHESFMEAEKCNYVVREFKVIK